MTRFAQLPQGPREQMTASSDAERRSHLFNLGQDMVADGDRAILSDAAISMIIIRASTTASESKQLINYYKIKSRFHETSAMAIPSRCFIRRE